MSMTIFQRALELVADGTTVGIGSGRAAAKFTELLGERVRNGLNVRGVPTSQAAADVAHRSGIPLVTLADVAQVDVTVDGADEVDPRLDLIKGYGRALVREKIVAAASRRLVILVGTEKLVPVLGNRGRLPVEVVPFAVPSFLRWADEAGLRGTLHLTDGNPFVSDNGNHIVDCALGPTADAAALQNRLRSIPGVVDTGLFLGMADVVLVGHDESFDLQREMQRSGASSHVLQTTKG